MKEDETRQQLSGEVAELRQRLAELEVAEAERRQAEEALRQSEKRFRALIENSADAISLIDATGTVLYNSPPYGRMLGYSEEERRGRNTFELVHPEDREPLLGLFARILQKPDQVGVPPTRIRHADGSWHWIEGVATNLLAEPSVQAIVVNFRDITQRRQAAEALRQSEDKFKYVFDHSIVGKSITLPSGEISVNKAFCEMLGYTAEELQNQKWQDISHPDDIEPTQRAIDPLLSGEKESLRFVKRYLHKSGALVWADVSTSLRRDNDGKPLYFMTAVNDITDRKRAEEALKAYSERLEERVEERTQELREREQWLSTTLRSIGDAVIATDAQGVVTLVNPVAEDLTGWDKAQAVGQPLADVFSIVNEQTGEPVESPVARVLREGVVVGLANHTLLIARDGTRRPIADSGAPMQDEAGKIIGTVMVFRDITARRRAEEALERRVAELSALGAMATIINESLEVDEILNRAMDEALRLVGVEAAAMMLLEEERGELMMAAHRGISDEFVQAFSRMKLGEGLSGQVAQTGEPAVLRDLAEYPEARRSYLEAEKIRSAAVVPLLGRSGVIGTMNLAAASSKYFDAEGLDLLVSMGQQIAIGVEKARLHEAVRQSQERLHYLVSSSPAVIYTSQAYGDYGATFISENVIHQMGYEPQEFIEDSGFWAAHIHPDDAPRIFDGLPRLFEHGHHTHEYRFLCKGGTYRWMRDELKLVRDADGEPVEIIGYWVDITERVQAEEALRVQRDLAVVLNQTRSLGETLDAILEGIFQIEEFDSGGAYLLDEQLGEFVLAAHKNLPKWFVAQVSRFGRDTPQWQLVMKGEPIYQHASGFPPAIAKELESESIKALAVIPLKYGANVIGDINLASHTHDEISEESKDIAWSVASLVGTAIARAQAEEELRKHREHLKELVEERTTELQQEITERKRAEEELARRVAELERFNRLAVGREMRMIELKRRVNELSEQLGQEPPYDLSILEG